MENAKKIERKRDLLFELLKYLTVFLCFYVFFKGNISGIIFPFAFGFLFALMWCNFKVYLIAPLYVLAGYLASFSIMNLYANFACVFVLLIVYLIHLKLKKRIKYWQLGLYAFISQIPYLCIEILINNNYFLPPISVVLGVMFLFACVKFFEAIIIRGFAYRLTVDEIICGAVVLVGFSCGVCSLSIGGFELVKFFAIFAILFSSYCYNVSVSLFVSGIMGIGVLFSTGNPIFVSAFILWAMASSCFKSIHKIFSVLAILVVEAVIGWYFQIYDSYSIISFLPCLIACIFFAVLPNKVLDEFKGFFSCGASEIVSRNIVNQNREIISKKLAQLSDVFAQMDSSFRGLIKGGLTKEQTISLLKSEIKEKICIDCPEKNKCHRVHFEETDRVLDELISNAFERGKTTLIDIPPFLTSRCNRINPIITNINELTSQYKQYDGLMKNFDASRILIAEQLGGVSKILYTLSKDINKNISFDTTLENKILDELTYQNLIISDVVVYEKKQGVMNVALFAKSEDSSSEKIANVVSKVVGHKMIVESVENSPRSGWNIVNLITSPQYDLIFGTAMAKKSTSEISGDSYSVIKIDSDKYMLALCDGMGSGKKAEKTSNLAMGIIENFYKAGFDNELILSSSNKLLSLGNDEMFSALDMLVVDLRQGIADVIKLGAPISLLKSKGEIKIIDSNALPLGILQESKPSIKKLTLSNSDIIILATDGVVDSFYSNEDYTNFVNNIEEENPKEIANKLLKQAIKNNGGSCLDDMTILALKIYQK